MQRDFSLALFSAVAGVAMGFLLSGFDSSKFASWALLASLSLAMIVSLALIGPLALVFRSPGSSRVAGKWRSQWKYKKGADLVVIEDDVDLRQHGQYIVGTAQSVKVAGPFPDRSVRYKLSGRVTASGGFLGSRTSVAEGKRYGGVFQGIIHTSGEKIQGAWIGTDATGLHGGQWELHKR